MNLLEARALYPDDPWQIIGMEVKAADGGDYGHKVIAYNSRTNDYTVVAICWSTGIESKDVLERGTRRIGDYKITYRYDLESARKF